MDKPESKQSLEEPDVPQQIMNTIIQLNHERVEQEKNHNFIEAARIKEQLDQLGMEYQEAYIFNLRQRQQSELEGLENQYESEMSELAELWDKRLEENEEEIRGTMMAVQEQQSEEVEKYREELSQNMPMNGKMSPSVLNLEFQIEKMVRKQRYHEAALLQKRLEKERGVCMEKIGKDTEEKMRNLLENFIKRHETELHAVEVRLNSERDELLTMREKDFENLNNKFKVYREKLESNHNTEINREEKNLRSFNPSSNFLLEIE
jgi:hypothetical protein